LEVTRESLEGLGYWPVPDPIEISPEDAAAAVPSAPSLATPEPDDATVFEASAEVSPPAEPDSLATLSPVELAPGSGIEDLVVGEAASEPVAPPPPAQDVGGFRPAATERTAPPQSGFEATTDDIDEEIREVFIEEVQEEIANLEALLPAWKADPTALDQPKPIRRVFHTLK